MKNIKIKYVLIILILAAAFKLVSAAEIEKYSVGSMKDVDVYMLKGVNTTKQLTIKGLELNLNIIGSDKAKFEIFTSKQDSDLERLLGVDKELKQTIPLDTKYDADIMIEKNKNELTLDLTKVRNGLLLVPKNISLVVDIIKGKANIQGTSGEILINGQQLETNITNVSAVINYMNKSGDISISNYEGVANMKSLHGDISVVNSSGKLKFQSTASDVNINKFIGDIEIDIAVGDIQILNSEDMSISLENKSGDVLLKNIVGKIIDINSASSDLDIINTKAKEINIKNLSGDIILNKILSDLNIDLNSGDVKMIGLKPNFKIDSKIDINFGDIDIEIENPKIYQYFQSINENELDFDGSIKIDKDLKICTKDKKCIVISIDNGEISVKTKK